MMYYVNCSCVPTEVGGPVCHSANCELRQLPMTCVEANSATPSDPNRQQLITVVSHPGPLVPLPIGSQALQGNDSVTAAARIVFQTPPLHCESLPQKPVAGNADALDTESEYIEQSAPSQNVNPGYSKPVADWSESHVKVFLDIYGKERAKFITRGLVSKKLWEEVAQKVNRETGLQLKGSHCDNKWKVLMRGYRRAERDLAKGDINDEQFRRSNPLFEKMRSILAQEAVDADAVTAKDVQTLSRESRMVWRAEDSRRLLHHYGEIRKRQRTTNVSNSTWDEIARLIHRDISSFTMNGSHCYSRFRFLRLKYQRAMLLCKDDASRRANCPMFNELHAILWDVPLPSEVPLTPSQLSKKKKESRLGEASPDDRQDDEANLPSVIQLESSRQPQQEFTAYLAKLVDDLAASLKDRAMQDILGYVFNFRKKLRLSKAPVPPNPTIS